MSLRLVTVLGSCLLTAVLPAVCRADVTPVYASLAAVSKALEDSVGASGAIWQTLFNAMLFVFAVGWIAWQSYTAVGQYSRGFIGLLDVGMIAGRSLLLVGVLLTVLSI